MFSPDYFNCTTCHIQGDRFPLDAPDVLGGDTGRQLEVLRDYLLTLGTP